MSYLPMMFRNFAVANVDENNENTKAVMKVGSSQDLNQSLEEMDPELSLAHKQTLANKLNPSNPPEPLQEIHHEKREYGCKHCPKKFSNRQALGGHQNAHKIERVTAKRARQWHEADFGYTGTTSFLILNSFNQAPSGTISQTAMYGSYHPQLMQHQMRAYEYSGSMFPMSHVSQLQHQIFTHKYPVSMFPSSHESHVVQPSHGLRKLCARPSSQFMSFHTTMGQSADTTNSLFSANTKKNDQVEHCSRSNKSENETLDDVGLDLSLKL